MKIGHRVGFGRMLWILVAVLVCSVMFSAGRASAAAPSEDELYRRALLNAMEKCYYNNEMVSSVNVGGANAYRSFGESILKVGKESGDIWIPTGIGTGNGLALSKTDGTKIGCYELFLGDPEDGFWSAEGYEGKLTGLFGLYNVRTPGADEPTALGNFLKNIGYTVVEDMTDDGGDTADMTCLNVSYKSSLYDDPDFLPLKKYCFLSSALDGHTVGGWSMFSENGGDYYYEDPGYGEFYNGGGNDVTVEFTMREPWLGLEFSAWYTNVGGYRQYLGDTFVNMALEDTFLTPDILEEFAENRPFIFGEGYPVGSNGTDIVNMTFEFKLEITHEAVSDDGGSAADMFTKYSWESWWEALAVARESLSGERSAREFSDFDKYTLYVLYLKKVYGADLATNPECKSSVGSEDDVVVAVDGSAQKKYYIYAGSSGWCRIIPMTTKKEYKVSGFIPDERYILSTVYDFEGLVRAMYYLDTEEISANGGGFGGTSDGGSYGGDNSGGSLDVKPSCYDSAASLGWALCTVLDLMSGAAEKAYNDYVEPALSVDPQLFSGGGGSLQQAWGVFQGIANTLFVVLLLAVIFSQLTGVGIDNYGIKKILPKLIVSAVLVNLSYWICLACVDLSNIIGNGLQNLFNSLPVGTMVNSIEGVNVSSATGSGGLVSAGLLVALVAGIWSVVANPAVLITLLVSALGVVISIFFLFVLLSAREAAIVVLVVISPLAFVCYMLPNTKKLFDKFIKLGEGLLLVYPIAGLLVGGGGYVSRLLLTDGFASQGFIAAFTAIIVGIAPIFFIPSLLKGSFAALGNLGAKISGLGQRASSGATRKIRSAEGYKAAQARGYARKMRVKAGLDKNYKPTARGNLKASLAKSKFGRAVGYAGLQRARLASARKEEASMIEGETALGNLQMEYSNARNQNQSTEDYLRGRLAEVADGKDDNAKFAVIDQMRASNMQASHIAQATRDIFGAKVQDKNFLEKFAKRYGGDFLKKDFEQLDWARNGGYDGASRVALGALVGGHVAGGSWINTRASSGNMGVDAMKDDEVAALSADRLYDAMNAGIVSTSQAQRVWASNANMDDINRLMLGAYGNGGTVLSKSAASFELSSRATGPRRFSKEQLEAWTRRAAERTVIEDVDLVNREGVVGEQTHNLGVDADTGGEVMNALNSIVGHTGATAGDVRRAADGVDMANVQLRQQTDSQMDAAVLKLDNRTLEEMVTDPHADADAPLQQAVEREVRRRIREGKMRP